MKQKKWKTGILLIAALLYLTGCKNEADSGQEEKIPVDKEVPALVIETEEPEEDAQKSDTANAPTDGHMDTGKTESQKQDQQNPSVLAELNTQITDFIREEQAKGTDVSVYTEDLTTGNFASVGSQRLKSASLIKLFIAGCVCEHPDIVMPQEAYEGETDELLRLMITVSDNDAANTLTTRLGGGNAAAGMQLVNEYCKIHDYPDTYMGRLMLDFNAADDNYTSASDCGHFLKDIYQNELAGSEKILSYMRRQERTGKIPAGVPYGIETANKTGELSDVENDAAIIFGGNGAYTLCVILNQLPEPEAGRTLITELSSMIYAYMEPGIQSQ